MAGWCFALSCWGATLAHGAPTVSASALATRDHTRIVLTADVPIRFSLFVLRNPDRLVLDLDGVEADAVAAALAGKVRPDDLFLKPPRVMRRDGGTRVEVDLKADVDPRIFASRAPVSGAHLLTLEVFPESAPTVAKAAPPVTPPVRAGTQELLLEVWINRQPIEGSIVALRGSDGRVLVSNEDLRRWRFRTPAPTPMPPDAPGGGGHQLLDAMPGLSYRVDEATQTLFVEAPPALFLATALPGQANVFAVPPAAPPGAFANYDVFASRTGGKSLSSGQFEVGAFNAWGVGVSSFLARSSGPGDHWVRLDTTWTHDMPASISSLRIGDAISAPGGWGRSVRFGGVQWATNFVTQPSFITFPLPGLAGEAILPSTVDLYVNNALRLRREVPAGPFSIQDLPVVTGSGEMRLVVRDVLGRERVIVQPFYATAKLLQSGLQEYSYDLGFVREDYALVSNRYGRALAVGTHRLGLSDRLTGEVRAEVLRRQQTGGLGAALLVPGIGAFSGGVAGSRGPDGNGALAAFGFERSAQRWSVGANTQVATARFVQVGLQPGELAPRQVSRAFASFSTPSWGSFGVSYAHQDNRGRESVELVSASYSLSLGRAGFVSFSALRFLGGDANTVLSINYTLPLDSLTTLSAGATGEQGSRQGQVQVQRNLPPGTGYGYRLLAGAGDRERFEAGASWQGDYGTYVVEAARAQGESAYRVNASGGMALIGWDAFLSRRIEESFAVVDVPGYPGVRVYSANQLVTRTGRAGTALIPRLLPYQSNPVRIEQADLPMDAQVGSLQVDAVPFFRSGVRLAFPVKRSRGALLRLALDSGDAMPAGAVVGITGTAEEFPVGLRGEVYVTGMGASNRLRAKWRGQSCEVDIDFTPTDDPLPDLGTHVCKGVAK